MASSVGSKSTSHPGTSPRDDRRHLQTLLRVSKAIGSIRNIDRLIGCIMVQTTDAFTADRSTLFLHDARRRQLWSRVAQGLEGWTHELRIADDQGLAGQVHQSGQSLLIADTFKQEHFARKTAEAIGYVPRSMIVVPIRHGAGCCDGALQVMDKRLGYFTDDDLELLEAVAVQVGISLHNVHLHQAQREQFQSFVCAFSAALDARDPTTQIHSINVANYAMAIGEVLGLDKVELEWLRVAGLLHDVGKIGTPEAILAKPDKLEPDEMQEMQRHAAHSRHILSQIQFTHEYADMALIAAAHHERLDGSGYPDGLTADELPLKARVLAVADVYHALTQDRQYRQGMSRDKALEILGAMCPHQVDSDCVLALRTFLGLRAPS